MAVLDFPQILKECISLAKQEVGKNWSKLKPFAEHEFTQFAENAQFLAELRLKNIIDDEELKVRLRFQQTALNNVLLAIKGIGLKTAENVVNGVLGILAKAIKSTINIVLPV